MDFEEEFGGDLHVVAQFEVGGEFDALGGGDVAVCDKDLGILMSVGESCADVGRMVNAHHICNRPPREDYAADELADEVETAVLIRNGHDNTHWYEEDGGDGKGE